MLKGADDTISSMPAVVSRVSRFRYGIQFGHVPGTLISIDQPPDDRKTDFYYFDPDGRELVRRLTWYLKKVCVPNTIFNRVLCLSNGR